MRPLSPAESALYSLSSGAVVEEADKGSAAEVAGVLPGDIVLEFAHAAVDGPQGLSSLVGKLHAGDPALLRVLRDGKTVYLVAKLQAKALPALSTVGLGFTPIVLEYSEGWEKYVGPVSYVSGYSHDGTELSAHSQFSDIIGPLQDRQADQLLQSADSKQDWGVGLGVLGVGLVIGSVAQLLYEVLSPLQTNDKPGNNSEDDFPNLVPFFVLFGGGLGAGIYGLFLHGEGAEDRESAVNRYNQVVSGLKDLSLMVLPRSGGPGLAYTRQF